MSIFDRVEVKPVMVAGAPAPPAAYTALSWKHTLIPVGMGAEGFAVSPDERETWVGNQDGTISILDLSAETIKETLAAGVPGANRLKFTPDGRLVLVTMHTGKELMVIDAASRKLVKKIAIEERGASGIAIQPDGARAFIACPRDHFVAVVDLRSLEKTGQIDAGREPDGLTWWTPSSSY
jgi:DNA-binding beta-propeller fold protein YncE